MTTALTTIDAAKKSGSLVYLNEGHLEAPTPLYKTEITSIQLDKVNDAHKITGKYAPKREVVDRIGEAAGISFIPEHSRTWSETRDDDIGGKRTVFISEQQAKIRMTDGSYRTSSVQAYEFDPTLRAMEEVGATEWNAQAKLKRKIGSDGQASGKTGAERALEFAKVARQRAETGARLRVIRELTGMPGAFTDQEISKPLTFARVMQNTDYLLQTPEGRMLAAAQATGTQGMLASLYGATAATAAPRDVTESVNDRPESGNDQGGFADDAPESTAALAAEAAGDEPASEPKLTELDIVTRSLEEFSEGYYDQLNVTLSTGKNPYQMIMRELQDVNGTVETRKFWLNETKKYLTNIGEKV